MPINATYNEIDRSDTLYVLTGGGVNADAIAGADEERNLDDEAGLGGGRFGTSGRGIALEARLGIGDGQHNFFGQVDGDRFALIEHDVEFQVIDQVVLCLAKLLFSKDDIVKGAGIHKMVLVAILVLIGGRAAIQVDTLELIARVTGAITDGSRTDIAQLHAHNCAAAPDLHVLPVENVAQLALKFNGQTLFQVASRYHGSNSLYLLAFYLFIIASYVNFDHMRVTFFHRMSF